jgi:2-oxoglutarate/2-oxoacid ferredoxin oxidoreductase subunit beta
MKFLNSKKTPFCPGCGHNHVLFNLDKTIEELNLNPLDIIVVSDIGCCGIIDPLLESHTIHGLHGRSVCLAMGVAGAFDKNSNKKVIAIQGDGGATIGLSHLLEGARRNFNITLIVHNNMVYGMTGGQVSGLSHSDLKKRIFEEEKLVPSFDLVKLAHDSGAAFSARLIAKGSMHEFFKKAVLTKGFSLIEVVELCPSYGYADPKVLKELGIEEVVKTNNREVSHVSIKNTEPLFEINKTVINRSKKHNLSSRLEILIAGSAGEGIQTAAEYLSIAALRSGLYVTKKSDYPITVGTGHSNAEIILDNSPNSFAGSTAPDILLVTSQDGLDTVKNKITENTYIIADQSLDLTMGNNVLKVDFRNTPGKAKAASLAAISFWLAQSNIIPIEELKYSVESHKRSDKLINAIENGLSIYEKYLKQSDSVSTKS